MTWSVRNPSHHRDSEPYTLSPPYTLFVSQWVIVDAKVYDLSRFANLHPGGRSVLVDSEVAGQDATEAFYGLHRHEVLERPQYARLQIGVLRGEKSVITGRLIGGLSNVPYAEPTYLTKGFHSPYYTEVRGASAPAAEYRLSCLLWCVYCDRITRRSRRWSASSSMKWFIPMRRCASSMGSRRARRFLTRWRKADTSFPPRSNLTRVRREVNLHAMRLGPGKHLEGRSLFHGLVKPEEVSSFFLPGGVFRLSMKLRPPV